MALHLLLLNDWAKVTNVCIHCQTHYHHQVCVYVQGVKEISFVSLSSAQKSPDQETSEWLLSTTNLLKLLKKLAARLARPTSIAKFVGHAYPLYCLCAQPRGLATIFAFSYHASFCFFLLNGLTWVAWVYIAAYGASMANKLCAQPIA